jgi:hypothetical protein
VGAAGASSWATNAVAQVAHLMLRPKYSRGIRPVRWQWGHFTAAFIGRSNPEEVDEFQHQCGHTRTERHWPVDTVIVPDRLSLPDSTSKKTGINKFAWFCPSSKGSHRFRNQFELAHAGCPFLSANTIHLGTLPTTAGAAPLRFFAPHRKNDENDFLRSDFERNIVY